MKKDDLQNKPVSNLPAQAGGTRKSDAALREESVLEFWAEKKIFHKTLEKKSPKGEFIFYDGPPTANGKPGIHHLVPQSFKDVIPRYKTMRGYHVRRKGGWDTHGLPVELLVEKELRLKSKKEIEKYGIAKFNQKCKESVWKYIDLWYKFRDRVGYWVDKDNPYVTYHNDYIESVWNVVKEVDKQKLLYKDYKVLPWCPRCGTALSSHELAQGYEDVKDLSVTAKFHLKPGQKFGKSKTAKDAVYILAWTTTPWTLPGNVALAVGEDIKYTALRVTGVTGVSELYILASDRVKDVFKDKEIEVVHDDIKGKDLIGLEYEPLYPYLTETLPKSEKSKLDKAYKVYGADFVSTEDGTGVVHTAVMYGQDDFVLGTKIGLPKHHLVKENGNFIDGMDFLSGRFVRDEQVAIDIIKNLAKRELLFSKEKYEHSYPHCWRCKTALIYYARDSWYIRMSDPKIKKQLISENKEINWEPSYIRQGRFGQWLEDIKDWAISRERYWGTPLPVWTCDSCQRTEVIGSVSELKEKTKVSGNKYIIMRHGESQSNAGHDNHGLISSKEKNVDHLTSKGEEEVKKTATKLKNHPIRNNDLQSESVSNGTGKIDLVFASPFMRTRETLDILQKDLGFKKNQIVFDKRLGELDAGKLEGKPWEEYGKAFKTERQRFLEPIHGGESILDVKKRMGDVLYELEEKYENKNILIISHGAPLWMLFAIVNGYNVDESISMSGGAFRHKEESEESEPCEFHHFINAEYRALNFTPIPHNEDYELDVHRPYIDEVKLVCKCNAELVRTPEVMDVWFDSGAMPFAQNHYPFENKKWVDGDGYPADYISEAIDQTRGWFYTLHAVGILMGRGKAYKNVISLGHLLDAKGKKMSKSIGNVVDPWGMMEKYGVDTLRLWMYSVNQPGEAKNFDENTVALLHNQVFGLLYNVLAFYELYRDKEVEGNGKVVSKNILDQWILARLVEFTDDATSSLDNYKILEPVRALRVFVNDLSTWYLRRSRDRIRNGDKEALRTLYLVLKTLAKVMAPFAPFAAEDIWQKLKIHPAGGGASEDKESVHLEDWPSTSRRLMRKDKVGDGKNSIVVQMAEVREVVSLGLKARAKAGVKVRQPLASLTFKAKSEKLTSEYIDLIKDEMNVKEVKQRQNAGAEVLLDTNITEELKQEGDYRELVRSIQDMRKDMGLTPSDVISISFQTNDAGQKLIQKFESDMKKTVLVSKIEFGSNDGAKSNKVGSPDTSAEVFRETVEVNGLTFKVKMVK